MNALNNKLDFVVKLVSIDILKGYTETNIKLRLCTSFNISLELANKIYRMAEIKLNN
jgi:hypothetical protein